MQSREAQNSEVKIYVHGTSRRVDFTSIGNSGLATNLIDGRLLPLTRAHEGLYSRVATDMAMLVMQDRVKPLDRGETRVLWYPGGEKDDKTAVETGMAVRRTKRGQHDDAELVRYSEKEDPKTLTSPTALVPVTTDFYLVGQRITDTDGKDVFEAGTIVFIDRGSRRTSLATLHAEESTPKERQLAEVS